MPWKPPEPAIVGSFTTWSNPTAHVIKFRLHRGVPVVQAPNRELMIPAKVLDPGYLDVEIPPGGKYSLSSEFDHAIQEIDENGVIQSGLAPQLIKDGVTHPMHDSLDPTKAVHARAVADAAAAVANKAEADRQLLIAEHQKILAEERQKVEAEMRAKIEAETRDKLESEAKAQAKKDAAERKKSDAEERERLKAEVRAELEAEAKAKAAATEGGKPSEGGKKG